MPKQTSPSWGDLTGEINGLRRDIQTHTAELRNYVDTRLIEAAALSDAKDKNLSIRINILWAAAGVIFVGLLAMFVRQALGFQ